MKKNIVKRAIKKVRKVLAFKFHRRITVEDLNRGNIKLGFGFNRLPYDGKLPDYSKINTIVDEYLNRGCNYFETGYNYMRYNSETIVKKCLVNRYPRKRFILCDKMPIRFKVVFQEGYEKVFQKQLKKCGVDFFDVYLLHNVGGSLYNKIHENGAFDFLKKIKADGRATLVGFSFHDKAELLDRILTDHPEVDLVQLQINYQDWDSNAIQSRLCYEVALKHNKPVLVMEPLKGGNLVNRLPKEAVELFNNNGISPSNLGLRWVASLDNVKLVLSGMGDTKHVVENIEALKMPCKLDENEQSVINSVKEILKNSRQVDCTDCGYCLDVCPKKIPVNDIFEILNNESRDGVMINRNANMFYLRNVAGKGKASDCINCGKCEDICSQRLEIRKHLKIAADIFEK